MSICFCNKLAPTVNRSINQKFTKYNQKTTIFYSNKFLDYNNRKNVMCPGCGSLERHRVIMYFLNKYKLNFNDTLHIAPEKILSSRLKKISKNYICGDIQPQQYNIENIIKLDVTNLQFSNKFDFVFASHILEHIIDDRLAISEIYKSLIKGGRFITMIPQKFTLKSTYEDNTITSGEDRIKHFGQSDHVRWYGLDFSQRLKDAGFYIKLYYLEEIEEHIQNMYFDEKIIISNKEENEKYGFGNRNIIYECIKL